MDDIYYDISLNIKTTGEKLWDDSITHYHPYQATSYSALESLFKEYTVNNNDNIVDFGCGKGRLMFYINYCFKAKVCGIEMDENYYKDCLKNKETYLEKNKSNANDINFFCCYAQDYKIKPNENKFYFFNPFSIQIFRKIIENILYSMENCPRKVQLILYYPSDDYIYYLENQTCFTLVDEILLKELYNSDSCERFLIYELDYSYTY